MQVRRNLLPNLQNFDVLNMLRFSLWGPDIFPKEAFEELKAKHPGKSNLDALLDISPKLPEDITNPRTDTGDKILNHPNKKQKVNHYPPNKKGGNKRGSRGGRNNNRGRNGSQQHNQNQNKNGASQTQQTGYNQSRGNQNRNPQQNNKGKAFQKGKQSNSQ